MAIISWKYKYLYLAAWGTGSTSTIKTLIDHYDGQYIPEDNIYDTNHQFLVRQKHTTVKELLDHKILTQEQLEELFIFTAVRNPYDFYVSQYIKRKKWLDEAREDPTHWMRSRGNYDDYIRWDKMTFEDFILENKENKIQKPQHLHRDYLQKVDFIMNFDNLNAEFEDALRKIGINPVHKLTRINICRERDREKNREWREYYTDEMKEVVARWHAPDFERFGFKF